MVGKPIPTIDGEIREKRRKELKRRRLGTYEDTENKMTLIIGARCKDGVVLIADKKAVEGTEITSQSKITILPIVNLGIVVAGAGTMEMTDKFNERIPFIIEERRKLNFEEEKKQKPTISINQVPYYYKTFDFFEDCEGLLYSLHESYKIPMEILVAGIADNKAELHFLNTEDCIDSRRRTYKCIGSGSPYATLLLKSMWDYNLTMEEMAKIGKFIIRFVTDSGMDNYVGDDVQIAYVRDFPENFAELPFEKQKRFLPYAHSYDQDSAIVDWGEDLKIVHELKTTLKKIALNFQLNKEQK